MDRMDEGDGDSGAIVRINAEWKQKRMNNITYNTSAHFPINTLKNDYHLTPIHHGFQLVRDGRCLGDAR